jgi:hypothetical protein
MPAERNLVLTPMQITTRKAFGIRWSPGFSRSADRLKPGLQQGLARGNGS